MARSETERASFAFRRGAWQSANTKAPASSRRIEGPTATRRRLFGTRDAGPKPMKPPELLRKLIRACVDDERTLQHERRFVDAGRAETFTRLARERSQFVEELERLGGRAPSRPNGSWAELLREAGREVWVAAAGRNNGDAVAACRHSRARTQARYDSAMQGSLPDEIRRALGEQLRRIRAEAHELIRLQF